MHKLAAARLADKPSVVKSQYTYTGESSAYITLLHAALAQSHDQQTWPPIPHRFRDDGHEIRVRSHLCLHSPKRCLLQLESSLAVMQHCHRAAPYATTEAHMHQGQHDSSPKPRNKPCKGVKVFIVSCKTSTQTRQGFRGSLPEAPPLQQLQPLFAYCWQIIAHEAD